jgi:DNA-binding NarL/FixJ family response regulator
MVTILLADDHTVVREGLRALLESQEKFHVVGVASNGRQAVRLTSKLCPAVVLMDIAMPGLNGIEATQQIRESCPDSQVVILSMYATSEYVYRALQAGALGYLLKESAGSEVVQAIRAVSAGKMYISRRIQAIFKGFTDQRKSPLERLSVREREVLQLTVEGKSSIQISGVSIVILSTYEDKVYRESAQRAGVDAYVTKREMRGNLIPVLEQLLEMTVVQQKQFMAND